LPALEALIQATRVRVLLEEGDDSSDDDFVNAIKMEVDSPPKTSSRGNADTPIDLTTSDDDSNKENERNHPGLTWMRYDRTNPEHYRIDIPEGDMTSAALYIRYCNAPTGGVQPDIGEGGSTTREVDRSYGKPEITGFTSPKVDVQAWLLSSVTVQEELL